MNRLTKSGLTRLTETGGTRIGGRMSEVVLIIEMRFAPVNHGPLLDLLVRLCAASRAERGCLRYDVFEQPGAPGEIMLYERWESAADFASHEAQPHVAAFRAASEGLIIPPVSRLLLSVTDEQLVL